jgi:hypothetical protein
VKASTRLRRIIVGGAASLALVLSASACGGDPTVPADPDSQQTCFTEMTPEQKAQINQYVNGNGGEVQTDTANADGTNDVCVIDTNGNEHYYAQDDHFSDYLLYSMMLRRSNALLGYGLITGDLDPAQYLMLSLLTGVNNTGAMYHPYSYTDRGWARTPTYVNRSVTNVYYGNSSTPVKYTEAKSKAPAKYQWRSYPKADDRVADVEKSQGGQTTVTSVKNMSAKKVMVSSNRVTPTANKRVDPPKSYKNPNKAPVGSTPVGQKTSSGSGTGYKQKKTTTGGGYNPPKSSTRKQ